MLTTGFVLFSFTAWVLGALIGGIYDANIAGGTNSALNTVLQFNIVREANVDLFFISFEFPTFNGEWFGAIYTLAVWQSDLWSGDMVWIRWVGLMGLSFTFALGMLFSFFGRRP